MSLSPQSKSTHCWHGWELAIEVSRAIMKLFPPKEVLQGCLCVRHLGSYTFTSLMHPHWNSIRRKLLVTGSEIHLALSSDICYVDIVCHHSSAQPPRFWVSYSCFSFTLGYHLHLGLCYISQLQLLLAKILNMWAELQNQVKTVMYLVAQNFPLQILFSLFLKLKNTKKFLKGYLNFQIF